MSKVLSIHQPNFIPWQGYFAKIKQSNIFIVLDSVQFPRGKSVANRNTIRNKGNSIEIVVPISKKSGPKGVFTFLDAKLSDGNWFTKPLKTIEYSYSKAPFFNEYFELVEKIFRNESFDKLNLEFIDLVTQICKIDTEIIYLSDLENISTDRNSRIIDLCKQFDATEYLSGKGGANYNDSELFHSNSIKLKYMNYTPPNYPQYHGGFYPNLSVLDLIFNHGPESNKYI